MCYPIGKYVQQNHLETKPGITDLGPVQRCKSKRRGDARSHGGFQPLVDVFRSTILTKSLCSTGETIIVFYLLHVFVGLSLVLSWLFGYMFLTT